MWLPPYSIEAFLSQSEEYLDFFSLDPATPKLLSEQLRHAP